MPGGGSMQEENKSSPLVGIATGGTRALAAQLFGFYTRVPVKLFRPARVDYTTFLRAGARISHLDPYSFWTHSSPALLVRAIHQNGWRFIPNKLLPPLVANSAAGSVLYTSYLSALVVQQHGAEPPQQQQTLRQVLIAGSVAGLAQALVATPIDAIGLRFKEEMIHSQASMWHYGREILSKMGWRAYGGLTLNALKESTSFALFFSVFELIKGPVYQKYSSWWYSPSFFNPEGRKKSRILYPSFVLMAGSAAAMAMQTINYPLSKLQKIHVMRLEAIDQLKPELRSWKLYLNSYSKTATQAQAQVRKVAGGSWLTWLYQGYGRYMLYSTPSTSIGLLVFEILRIRFSDSPSSFGGEEGLQAHPH